MPALRLLSRLLLTALLPVLLPAPGPVAAATEPEVQRRIPGLLLPVEEVKAGTAVEGVVSEVLVQEGDTVAKGQPLLKLADELERLDVERSEKVLEKARFDHEAAQRLLKDNIGTREEALRKSIEHDLARIQRDAAVARVEQKTIRSPIPGIVVSRDKEPGEAVQLHEVLLQVVNIRQVEAQFYLEPAAARSLQTGTVMNMRLPDLPADQQTVEGKVAFIDPRIDAESGLVRIKVLLENPGLTFKAGMRAELLLKKTP